MNGVRRIQSHTTSAAGNVQVNRLAGLFHRLRAHSECVWLNTQNMENILLQLGTKYEKKDSERGVTLKGEFHIFGGQIDAFSAGVCLAKPPVMDMCSQLSIHTWIIDDGENTYGSGDDDDRHLARNANYSN